MGQLNPRHGLTGPEMNKLWGYWCRLRERGSHKQFGVDFDGFALWSKEHGYEDGMRLVRIDSEKPIAPDNAKWVSREEALSLCASNEIPTSHPCETCSRNHYCVEICKTRAKWWDVQMEKIRKGLKL